MRQQVNLVGYICGCCLHLCCIVMFDNDSQLGENSKGDCLSRMDCHTPALSFLPVGDDMWIGR